MHRRFARTIILASLLTGAPALANDWGKLAEAQVCADLAKWSGPECQAEIARRTQACLVDDDMQTDLGNVGYTPSTPNDEGKALCKKEATREIQKQLAGAGREKAAAAAADKEREEALQKRDLPKATAHAPAIEKLVGSTFAKLYPEKKLLKVILDAGADWEIERTPLGGIRARSMWATVVSKKGDQCELYGTYWEQAYHGKGFSGPLVEHGAGGDRNDPILCANVK
jgi:hypothetical protein